MEMAPNISHQICVQFFFFLFNLRLSLASSYAETYDCLRRDSRVGLGHLKQPGLLAKRDRTAFCFVCLLSGHLDVLAALVEVLFVKSVFVLVQEGPLHPLCPPAAMPNPCRMRRGSSPGAIYVYVFQFAVCYPSLSRSLSSASIWFPKLKSGDVTFGVRLRDVVPTTLTATCLSQPDLLRCSSSAGTRAVPFFLLPA